MKNVFRLLPLLLNLLLAAPEQVSAQGTVRRHLILFTDKAASPYSTAAPQQFLTTRAIQRRARQGIAVTTRDLPPNPAYVALVRNAGAPVVYRTRWFNGVVVACDSTVLAQVRALPCVANARTVSRITRGGPAAPAADSGVTPAARPATANYYGKARNQAAMLDAVTMHDFGYRGDGIHVAVIDMGFPGVNTALPFQPLIQQGRVLSTYDFVARTTNVYKGSGHGTNALGCIVGNQPNTYVGTAPNVSVHLFITEDGTSEKPVEEVNWLIAAERADSLGVDVISTSLVYKAFDAPFTSYTNADLNGRTAFISRAATLASATGMLVVNAAGNSGTAGLSAPADADSVLTVGSVDSLGAYSSFSSRGPTADGRIKPNVAGQGTQAALLGSTGRVSLGNGTSFACPIVAGLAAGFWQANPSLTAQQVKQYLQQSGSNATFPTNLIGWGIPHFRRAYDLANPANPLPQPPTLTGFSPTSGPAGTVVTLTGTFLNSVTAATLNGTALTNLTPTSATQLRATIPAGATSGTFTVTNPAGTATSGGSFTVTLATPGLTFTPAAGSPGSVVLVSGTGFTTGTVVGFNGAAATGTVYQSATRLTATVPFGATTGSLTATTGATVLTGNAFSVTAAAAPTIRLFSPTAAPVGSVVTLTGANFSGATQVRFGSVVAPGFSVVAGTSLTVPVPAGAENARIYVLTPAGMAQTPADFTLILPPTLTSFAPAGGTPGAVVEIRGTHLTGATDVTFGGVAATSFAVQSATLLTATVPAGAATGPLAVTTVAGTATSVAPFTITLPPPPTITGFSPAAGAVGMAVVITGTNFGGATQVRFNTTPAVSFTINSATQITATVPVGASLGKISVLTAGGMAQSAAAFRVVPVPTLSSFYPATGSPGAVVLLTGTGLTGATSVTIGGGAVPFVVNSASQITATVVAGAAGGLIRVTTPGGTATSAGTFGLTAPVAPALTGFSPSAGPVGASVMLTGTSLGGATAVRFGNTAATGFTVNSATSITATVPVGATTGKLYVVTGGGMAASAAAFTVIQPPTLTALLPDNGTRGSVVVLQGTNLTGTTGVTFGGAAATSFTVNSAKQITAVVPNAAVTGPVTVTTAAGPATGPAPFTITLPPPPTISGLAPASGTPGTRVTLTGTNFVNVRRVLFGLKEVESFVVTSATSLTAQVPGNAVTGPVYVVADGGLGASAAPFTVLLPPAISGFTPVRGPVGTVVTVSGTNLTGVTDVRFGATTAAFTLLSATSLTAAVPAGAATAQVRVSNGLGTAVSAGVFSVTVARTDTAGAAWLARQVFPAAVGAYPNPAHGHATVQLRHWPAAEPLPTTADLLDALGRRVRTAPLRPEALPTADLPLDGLAPGLYWLRIGGVTGRLVVE